MRIGFMCRGEVGDYGKKEGDAERAELLLFGFEGMGEVSYEKELKGQTDYFETLALLSKREKNVVVSGCITDTMGHKRRSAVVAESGKLLGVSDMLNVVDGAVGAGAGLRVYETKIGKMGVVVAEDLYFPETVRALALCGSDFIVCPFAAVKDGTEGILLRANAVFSGVPVFFCGKGYSMIADPSGAVAFASPHSPVYAEYVSRKEYHLIETRRHGCFPSGR